MRLAVWLLSVACFLSGVLAACGGQKHPPLASEEPTPTVTTGGDDSGATDAAVVDAGPAPAYCLDVPEGGVAVDCHCTITNGMLTIPLACGLGLCVSYSTTVQICDYDGKLKMVPNIPFSVCTSEAGIPPCTPTAGASDAGSNDADAGDG